MRPAQIFAWLTLAGAALAQPSSQRHVLAEQLLTRLFSGLAEVNAANRLMIPVLMTRENPTIPLEVLRQSLDQHIMPTVLADDQAFRQLSIQLYAERFSQPQLEALIAADAAGRDGWAGLDPTLREAYRAANDELHRRRGEADVVLAASLRQQVEQLRALGINPERILRNDR